MTMMSVLLGSTTVERPETVELRRFSLRQLLALVYVVALLLAVCPLLEVGIAYFVLGCLAWVCDAHLRRHTVSEKVRPWARLTSAGFFVGTVFAIHYLWAQDPSQQMASLVGGAQLLLFAAPSAEAIIRLIFAIPIAILGYCLIVSPSGLLSHVRSQRPWQVAIAVAPAIPCLAIWIAICTKHGVPSNGLAAWRSWGC